MWRKGFSLPIAILITVIVLSIGITSFYILSNRDAQQPKQDQNSPFIISVSPTPTPKSDMTTMSKPIIIKPEQLAVNPIIEWADYLPQPPKNFNINKGFEYSSLLVEVENNSITYTREKEEREMGLFPFRISVIGSVDDIHLDKESNIYGISIINGLDFYTFFFTYNPTNNTYVFADNHEFEFGAVPKTIKEKALQIALNDKKFKDVYKNSNTNVISNRLWYKNEQIQPNNKLCPGEGKIVLYKQKPYDSSIESLLASRIALTPAPPPSEVVCVDIFKEKVKNISN